MIYKPIARVWKVLPEGWRRRVGSFDRFAELVEEVSRGSTRGRDK